MIGTKKQWIDALFLGLMQFLSYGICTISWRAVAQANVFASVLTDSSFATVNFFVIKKIAKKHEHEEDNGTLVPWLGYTVGGVLGTVTGIYTSLWWLGK